MKLDFTKPGTAEEKYDARINNCPKCGRRALVIDDPLVGGKKIYVHQATSQNGVLTATNRCEE
jgi:hypothetical protein